MEVQLNDYKTGWWDAFIQTIKNTVRIYGVKNVNVAILSDVLYDSNITDDEIEYIIVTHHISDEVKSVLRDLKRNLK